MAGADDVAHDIQSILSSSERDYLVRNNGDQVKIESLKGKKVGLYFSASWCPPCRRFTPTLKELYNKVSAKSDFEIVFVSADKDEDASNGYFSKMPWLTIPFSDANTRNRLNEIFKVQGIPHLLILDENGKVATEDGTTVVLEYEGEASAFTTEWIKELKHQEEEARRNQSLRSLLVFRSRDFVISSDGKQVPVSELEGKTIGLYFSASSFPSCAEFTPRLVEVYEKLKAKGENFEIVFISVENDEEESFKQGLKSMAWLALPYKDEICVKLARYFQLSALPTLAIIGPDGKTLHSNVVKTIEDHGVAAYPFTPEKFAELAEIEKAKEASEEMAKGWPEKVSNKSHEHELVLSRRRIYYCDGCDEEGQAWSYYCDVCDFDLHHKCALQEVKPKERTNEEEEKKQDGWVCDEEVCSKA